MKDTKFITVCPVDVYYTWQVHLWLESLKKIGHSDKAIVLLYQPFDRQKPKVWDEIEALYPEATFKTYVDDKNELGNLLSIYIPILRPYCLSKWWTDNPEMQNCNIFYCDSDVIFTHKFTLDGLLEDDVCYLSNTNSYINASYFDSKIKDVLPEKLEQYKQLDVLSSVTSLVGISRDICEANNGHSGGAQYLLKNINTQFWNNVLHNSIVIYRYLSTINAEFFPDESKGFQRWCSDMWAVLWQLWRTDHTTKVVKQLDFAWATDSISKLETTTIYHNAGISSDITNGFPTFFKGKYHSGKDISLDIEELYNILENPKTQKYCTYYYTQQLVNLLNKYKIKYK